jgi:hypothetical protein
MKRSRSNFDTAQQPRRAGSIPKRRRTQHVDPRTCCTSPPFTNPSNPSTSTSQLSHALSQSFASKKEALKHTQQPVTNERASWTQHWLETCSTNSDPDMMVAQPTPRGASVSSRRGRRLSKRSVRASRTPSPSKRPSPQTYRTQNMSYAGVLIDDLIEYYIY